MEAVLDLFMEVPAKGRIVVFGDVKETRGSYGLILQHLGECIGKISSKVVSIYRKRQFCAYAAGTVCGGLSRFSIYWAGTNVFQVVEQLRDELREVTLY